MGMDNKSFLNLNYYCYNICKLRLNCNQCLLSGDALRTVKLKNGDFLCLWDKELGFDDYVLLGNSIETSLGDSHFLTKKIQKKQLIKISGIKVSNKKTILIDEGEQNLAQSNKVEDIFYYFSHVFTSICILDEKRAVSIPSRFILRYFKKSSLKYFCKHQCIFNECNKCPLISFKSL